jgi:hypothetical protein
MRKSVFGAIVVAMGLGLGCTFAYATATTTTPTGVVTVEVGDIEAVLVVPAGDAGDVADWTLAESEAMANAF